MILTLASFLIWLLPLGLAQPLFPDAIYIFATESEPQSGSSVGWYLYGLGNTWPQPEFINDLTKTYPNVTQAPHTNPYDPVAQAVYVLGQPTIGADSQDVLLLSLDSSTPQLNISYSFLLPDGVGVISDAHWNLHKREILILHEFEGIWFISYVNPHQSVVTHIAKVPCSTSLGEFMQVSAYNQVTDIYTFGLSGCQGESVGELLSFDVKAKQFISRIPYPDYDIQKIFWVNQNLYFLKSSASLATVQIGTMDINGNILTVQPCGNVQVGYSFTDSGESTQTGYAYAIAQALGSVSDEWGLFVINGSGQCQPMLQWDLPLTVWHADSLLVLPD